MKEKKKTICELIRTLENEIMTSIKFSAEPMFSEQSKSIETDACTTTLLVVHSAMP